MLYSMLHFKLNNRYRKGTVTLLRILLWKLSFEWTNLMRIVRPQDDEKIYYFAFGANLSTDILKLRRIHVYEAFDYALDDAALRFTQLGFYKDHGYASADHVSGEKAYGKMYLIRKSDAARMDHFEGVPFLQVHDKVFNDHQGKPFFYYRAKKQSPNLKPTQEYLDYITQAYRKMALVPEAYVTEMEKTEVLEKLEPQDKTGKFIKDLQRWPQALHLLLTKYEAACQQTVRFLWNRSLVDWMIKA